MNSEIDKYNVFVMQRSNFDCGVACLQTIIRLHHGNCCYVKLQKWCNTSQNGTSIQGIKQAAKLGNLAAEAFYVQELKDFKKARNFPCLLLVINKQFLNHFIVCYELTKENLYKIFDPAKGLEIWNEDQLLSVWKSKVVVLLSPNQNFKKIRIE